MPVLSTKAKHGFTFVLFLSLSSQSSVRADLAVSHCIYGFKERQWSVLALSMLFLCCFSFHSEITSEWPYSLILRVSSGQSFKYHFYILHDGVFLLSCRDTHILNPLVFRAIVGDQVLFSSLNYALAIIMMLSINL